MSPGMSSGILGGVCESRDVVGDSGRPCACAPRACQVKKILGTQRAADGASSVVPYPAWNPLRDFLE